MRAWQCLHVEILLGEEFSAAINGRYLKKYYPSIEIDR
jgi:hypothetical protein